MLGLDLSMDFFWHLKWWDFELIDENTISGFVLGYWLELEPTLMCKNAGVLDSTKQRPVF